MRAWKNVLVAGVVALALAFFASAANAAVPLGLYILNSPTGVVVTDVTPGRIADRCMPRLRPGARIVTVNGQPLTSAEQFQQIVLGSDFIKFQFIDATGALRSATAWSGGNTSYYCRP